VAPGGADEDSPPWWAGVSAHWIELQRCTTGGLSRFPPMPGCPQCGSTSHGIVAAPGGGVIYSAITIGRSVGDRSANDVPRVIATVELDEGCRILGRLLGAGEPSIGARVQPVFLDASTGTETAADVHQLIASTRTAHEQGSAHVAYE
jgi:uncharacterized protein